MNRPLILLITLTTVFSLTGCTSKNEQNNGLITIDIEDAIDSFVVRGLLFVVKQQTTNDKQQTILSVK
jgi:hypothetical protein